MKCILHIMVLVTLLFQTTYSIAYVYLMEYSFESSNLQAWAPVPRKWDGSGVKKVQIHEISPIPTDWYRESNGVEIAYWEQSEPNLRVYKIVFKIQLSQFSHVINPYQYWPPYDVETELYKKFTLPTLWAQSDSDIIKGLANNIIGSTNNPYLKAQKIHNWTAKAEFNPYNINDYEDALSVLSSGRSECGGRANLFVALCRSVGIPARNVTSMHEIGNSSFSNSTLVSFGKLGTHVWAEFYLPDYGWVQCDPGEIEMFANIPQERVITAKGNDILLGHDYQSDDHANINGQRSWFHMPCAPGQVNIELKVLRSSDFIEPSMPVAEFSSNEKTGNLPLTIDFVDLSQGEIFFWLWDFGNGTINKEQNPSHTYIDDGIYSVKLSVGGAGGVDSIIKSKYINVKSPNITSWLMLLLDD